MPPREQRAERHPVRGAVHERTGRDASRARHRRQRSAISSGVVIGAPPPPAAAHRAEEHVLVAPHHALRHAGRAAGVQDVERVGGAGGEVARRATRPRARPRTRPRRARRAAIAADRRRPRRTSAASGSAGAIAASFGANSRVEDDRARVGVVEEVPQFLLDVAVVHVDRHGAELERGEHRLRGTRRRCTGRARRDRRRRCRVAASSMREAGRARVGLGEGEAASPQTSASWSRHRVGDAFPQSARLNCIGSPGRGRNRTGAAAT